MSNSAEYLLKERFVEEWLRCGDPFRAALVLYPDDTGKALKVQIEWPRDPEVLEIRREFGGAEAGLVPSREELIAKAYKAADEAPSSDDKAKLYRLTAEMCGYIQKPEVSIDNRQVNVTNNRVMVVSDHGSDEQWEEELASQQRALTSQARAN